MQTNRSVRSRKPNILDDPEPISALNDSEKCREVVSTSSETGKSKYFQNASEEMDVDNPVTSNKRKHPYDPMSNELMNQSSLEESGGPSFFERMLLDDVSKNGKRIKLNVLPVVPQPSPGKTEDKPPDISDAVSEVKAKSSKVNDFFKKSPVGSASRDNDGKMSKPTKEAVTPFFTKNAPNWVDPTEIFPDVEVIDEATLAVFPPSYQKRILDLKRAKIEERKRNKGDGTAQKISTYDKNILDSVSRNDKMTSEGSPNSRLLPSNHSIVEHGQVLVTCPLRVPQEEPQCAPFFNTRPLSCVTKKGLEQSTAENGSRSCQIPANSPNKSSNYVFVPKQSQRYKIHDSQQPSTSKCGFERAMDTRSPEDVFSKMAPSWNGPSNSRDSSSNDDMFEREDSPKSPKTDSSISKELGKYTIHDSQVPSTSKCQHGDSSPEDIFAQEPCWQPSLSAQPPSVDPPSPSLSAQQSWRGASPVSDDSNSNDRILPKISCPECQVLLHPDEVDEHADFHFALKLQEEMNQPVPARPVATTSIPNKPEKRKTQSKSSKKPDCKKMKSIDSFFKKAS